MEKAISEIVGHAELDEGGKAEVYRALRPLLCAMCGMEIAEGSLFTRGRLKGIGVRIMPHCSKCAPFTLQAGKKEKSALLRSLLTEQPEDSSRRSDASAPDSSDNISSIHNEEKKKLDEEIRQRLGPALKLSRQRRK